MGDYIAIFECGHGIASIDKDLGDALILRDGDAIDTRHTGGDCPRCKK